MEVREAASADAVEDGLRRLRADWRAASVAAGWRFPSDWGVPEVDQVCRCVVEGEDPGGALACLGRARARAGAGLDETLDDLAALHGVLDGGPPGLDTTPVPLLRTVVLAWADAALGELGGAAAVENLTGLATPAYLRVRLGEVYRAARRQGVNPSDRYVLLVVRMDLSETTGWPRLMAMALVADSLREVFDGGESLVALGPSVAGVLTERAKGLVERAVEARKRIVERFTSDTALRSVRWPDLRVERLPTTEQAAEVLLDRVARA